MAVLAAFVGQLGCWLQAGGGGYLVWLGHRSTLSASGPAGRQCLLSGDWGVRVQVDAGMPGGQGEWMDGRYPGRCVAGRMAVWVGGRVRVGCCVLSLCPALRPLRVLVRSSSGAQSYAGLWKHWTDQVPHPPCVRAAGLQHWVQTRKHVWWERQPYIVGDSLLPSEKADLTNQPRKGPTSLPASPSLLLGSR